MASALTPIATTTLGSAASSITFSSIPSTYTHLRAVVTCGVESPFGPGYDVHLTFNGDTGTNYSTTVLNGDGSSVLSFASTNDNKIICYNTLGNSTSPGIITINVFLYSGSSYKTTLSSTNVDVNGYGGSGRQVGLWRSTSAITSLSLTAQVGSLTTGTTATLFGIKAA